MDALKLLSFSYSVSQNKTLFNDTVSLFCYGGRHCLELDANLFGSVFQKHLLQYRN